MPLARKGRGKRIARPVPSARSSPERESAPEVNDNLLFAENAAVAGNKRAFQQ